MITTSSDIFLACDHAYEQLTNIIIDMHIFKQERWSVKSRFSERFTILESLPKQYNAKPLGIHAQAKYKSAAAE